MRKIDLNKLLNEMKEKMNDPNALGAGVILMEPMDVYDALYAGQLDRNFQLQIARTGFQYTKNRESIYQEGNIQVKIRYLENLFLLSQGDTELRIEVANGLEELIGQIQEKASSLYLPMDKLDELISSYLKQVYKRAEGEYVSRSEEIAFDHEKVRRFLAAMENGLYNISGKPNSNVKYALKAYEQLRNLLDKAEKLDKKYNPNYKRTWITDSAYVKPAEPVGIYIPAGQILSAKTMIHKATLVKRKKTAETAHMSLLASKNKDSMFNQFEILLLSDEERKYHDTKHVESTYVEALRSGMFYGAVGECIQKMVTKKESLKKQIEEESSMKHKMGYILGAVAVVAIVLFLLFSKLTAFLWMAEMEEAVQVALYIACGIAGLCVGGLIGLIAGIAIPAFLVSLITEFISMAVLFKIILCLIGGFVIWKLLSTGFANPRDNSDMKEKESEIEQLYHQCKNHLDALLLVLQKRDKTEYKHVIEYYQKALKKLDEIRL